MYYRALRGSGDLGIRGANGVEGRGLSRLPKGKGEETSRDRPGNANPKIEKGEAKKRVGKYLRKKKEGSN